MRQLQKPTTPAEMYDRALHYARDKHLSPDDARPHPTCDWPPENIQLLEEYVEWLASGGASPAVIRTIYLPMAGHILGLANKPHPQLDLEFDLLQGLNFLKAKQLSAQWTDVCRCAMLKFRRFLRHRRGQIEIKVSDYEPERHTEGLPEWLVQELVRYQHVQQRNWRPARLQENICRFWSDHLRLWGYLCKQCAVRELVNVKRKYLLDYIDHRLASGYAASGINADLRNFHSFLVFLQEQGYPIPQTLLRVPSLKQPDSLPKFLTDEQVRLLRDDFEQRVTQAEDFRQRRDALLDRAAFYLLWQSGLRLGEVEELRLEDMDLTGRKLTVRQSKGLKDRVVCMTDTTVRAVREYLALRGSGPTDHVFLYRNQPVCKDLIRGRIKSAGKRVGVSVYPHRLRHTAATQLINAGCRVTSIQKFLGHKELSTTMIYARVHDQTVADDYYTAMERIEQRMELLGEQERPVPPISENERGQLLVFAAQLAQPELSLEARLEIAALMSFLLHSREMTPINDYGRKQSDVLEAHPPPSPVLIGSS
jgi:site-specific recombinase XerD